MTDLPMDAPAPAPAATRAGFVALLGEPNAGKSTLLNQMVGAKVAIVTHKVQTTRARIRGITMAGASQLVFVDTPGLYRPRRRLDRAMVAAALFRLPSGSDSVAASASSNRRAAESKAATRSTPSSIPCENVGATWLAHSLA